MADETPDNDAGTDPADLEAARDALAAARASAAKATTAFRDALRAQHPAIPPELIEGDTVEAITASVTAGQAMVDKILAAAKETAGNGASRTRVPSGRFAPAPADMSSFQKLAWGVQHAQPTGVGRSN